MKNQDLPEEHSKLTSKWVMNVYMSASDGLRDEAESDFDAISNALDRNASGNLVVLVYLEGYSSEKNGYYKVESGIALKNAKRCRARDESHVRMPSRLRAFLDWGDSCFPATHRMLVIWSHAHGFFLEREDPRLVIKRIEDIMFSRWKDRSSLNGAQQELQPQDARADIKKLVDDFVNELSKGYLAGIDIGTLLAQLAKKSGISEDELRYLSRELVTASKRPVLEMTSSGADSRKRDRFTYVKPSEIADMLKDGEVDVLAFDSCFMGTIEAAYEFRRKAGIMIASEDVTSDWSFRGIVEDLQMQAEPLTAQRLALNIIQRAKTAKNPLVKTLAAIDLQQIADLAHAVSELAEALESILETHVQDVVTMRSMIKEVPDSPDSLYIVDIKILLDQIRETLHAHEAILPRVADVVNLLEGKGKSVMDSHADLRHKTPTSGLAIYFPPDASAFDRDPYVDGDYLKPRIPSSSIGFVREQRWADFINAYAAQGRAKAKTR
jgi:hypothetical protein